MRIAFYAPMKPPDHPTPSGDRTMARALVSALGAAGFDVTLASRLRAMSPQPAPEERVRRREAAEMEVRRLVADWQAAPAAVRPAAWFTYHLYYKAPDWIGPAVAQALAIPYLVAEASYAGKRDAGPWAPWQADARAAIATADVLYCLTAGDREGLARLAGLRGRLVDLPPFLAIDPADRATVPRLPGRRPRLVTVAMMRAGDKLASYEMLAEALGRLLDLDWEIAIVGDGPARPAVVEAFASLPKDRVAWRGELPADAVTAAFATSDLYVWPGFGEAFGLAYLEAAAAGLPSVAQATGGIDAVVRHGETGLLTPLGDVDAYASSIRRLLTDPAERTRQGEAAATFARTERTLPRAAAILRASLAEIGLVPS